MSAASRLQPRLAELLGRLKRHGRVHPTDVPLVSEALCEAVQAAAGRGKSARERTAERSKTKRDGVRQAIGALRDSHGLGEATGIVRRRIEVDPQRYGLKAAPCDRVIRRVIRERWAEINGPSEPKMPHARFGALYASNLSSSLATT